jgi:hypothetical protein
MKKCKECELGQIELFSDELCEWCSHDRDVVDGLKMAVKKTKCKQCLNEINEEIESFSRKSALGKLTRLTQAYGGYEEFDIKG